MITKKKGEPVVVPPTDEAIHGDIMKNNRNPNSGIGKIHLRKKVLEDRRRIYKEPQDRRADEESAALLTRRFQSSRAPRRRGKPTASSRGPPQLRQSRREGP